MTVNRFARNAPVTGSKPINIVKSPPAFTGGLFHGSFTMPIAVWIGTSAAIASTVSFTPQAWKIIKTGETKGISAGMYVITAGGFALWAIYGAILRQWPLVVSNSICLLLSGFILMMKLLPPFRKKTVAKVIKAKLP
jgi:MtN3 and saliva related transmembrane protein